MLVMMCVLKKVIGGRAQKSSCVEFGPVNEWCFDEESWPGPRTGEVSARKAFEDDCALIDKKGFRTTLASTANANSNAGNSKSSGVIQTPWGRIDKGEIVLHCKDLIFFSLFKDQLF